MNNSDEVEDDIGANDKTRTSLSAIQSTTTFLLIYRIKELQTEPFWCTYTMLARRGEVLLSVYILFTVMFSA